MKYAEGKCYCEKVAFKVATPATWSAHCHCTQCQKIHGAAFVTWAGFETDDWSIDDKEKHFTVFNSGKAARGFCNNCGSSFFFKYKDSPAYVFFALPNFTQGPDYMPTENIFYDNHAPWIENIFELHKKN